MRSVRTFQAHPRAVVVELRDLAEVAVDVDEAVQVDLVQQLHDAPRGLRVLLALCRLPQSHESVTADKSVSHKRCTFRFSCRCSCVSDAAPGDET